MKKTSESHKKSEQLSKGKGGHDCNVHIIMNIVCFSKFFLLTAFRVDEVTDETTPAESITTEDLK